MFNQILGGEEGKRIGTHINLNTNKKGLMEMTIMCFEEEDFKVKLNRLEEEKKIVGYEATIKTNGEQKIIKSFKKQPFEIRGMLLEELKTMGKVKSITVDNGDKYESKNFIEVEFTNNLCTIYLKDGNTITKNINYLEVSTTCFGDDDYSVSISNLIKAFDEKAFYEIDKVA